MDQGFSFLLKQFGKTDTYKLWVITGIITIYVKIMSIHKSKFKSDIMEVCIIN